MSELTALMAGLCAGRNALFGSLPLGARFVFDPADKDRPHCILVKTAKRGYRHEIGGRQWTTSARSACLSLPDLSPPTPHFVHSETAYGTTQTLSFAVRVF